MNLKIKKDLTSNWFKTLQETFCEDIKRLEKNKVHFKINDMQISEDLSIKLS